MKAYEIYYRCPGLYGSDIFICHDEDLDKILEEKTGYEIDRIKIESKEELPLSKVPIRNLDAQSFLNLIGGKF